MTCVVEQRRRADRCAATLRADPRVVGVDVLGPQQGTRARVSIDLLCGPSCDGLPGALVAALPCDVTIAAVDPQADHWRALLLL